jgi:hypothetical protein
VLFTTVPMTFVQSVFVPAFARQVGSFWPYPGSNILFMLGAALVGTVLLAFAIVYDTRLYAALQHMALKSAPKSASASVETQNIVSLQPLHRPTQPQTSSVMIRTGK